MPLTCEALHVCPQLELSWVRAAGGASFARHTHDEYVLGANLSGHERIWLDGRELDVLPGQVTLYNPLAVQGSAFGAEPVEYISVHLSAEALCQVIDQENLRSTRQAPSFEQGVLQHRGCSRRWQSWPRLCARSGAGATAAVRTVARTIVSAPRRAGACHRP
ncbi:AraC family ligand binding domain-containing protein [Pseudomonas sp. Teo4]|uniref:AraC family ligand binding domain-containing protein n=1 Tax=Pseudomonas sp. Teo4 TaxID=3064528 RepID=UPI002AB84EFF|nr:AraC family ligand binding domain-containing protein [Pseudomonas sp. Teo4]MDZ3993385.1 hypothetical protein [Pseudomonas sp. Teo4]